MTTALQPSKIVELALRKIGAIRSYATGGAGPHLALGLEQLDLIIGEITGTERLWWLVPHEIPVTLIAEQDEIDLSGVLDPDVMHVMSAKLRMSGQDDAPINLLIRSDWDKIEDRATKRGKPTDLYIERSPGSLAYPYPIAAEGGQIILSAQRMSPTIDSADSDHQFTTAWQNYLVTRLAIALGDGIVEQLPEQRLSRWINSLPAIFVRLRTFSNSQNVSRPRAVRPWSL